LGYPLSILPLPVFFDGSLVQFAVLGAKATF
jgi:hypothetical protein